MFKFLQILKERNISHQELFRSCDVNNDGNITIRELENVIQGISPEFYLKETQAIHNFFDIDRNGLCSEKEYMT
jgi:Ca2+-binding EF-hand superfamily protein